MPIRKIQFKKGKFYHIYNQGAGEGDIFFDNSDRERFLQAIFLANNENSFRGVSALEKNRKDFSVLSAKKILKARKISVTPLVEICAFCLMENHFHFLLKEKKKNGISRFMQKLGNSFGKYSAKKYGTKGDIFADRFKATAVEGNDKVRNMLGYINIVNPAQLVEPYMKIKGIENFFDTWKKADNYPWSSHSDFMDRKDSGLVSKHFFEKVFSNPKKYVEFSQEVLLGKKINIWEELKDISID